MPCSHRLPDKHQSRPICLGGWGADTRRIWYLSCDDGVKSFPQLKLRDNSLWENAGVEIFSEIQRKRRQVHEPQMLGRDRQNCSLKELGWRPGVLGWEPVDVTAAFTSWGDEWHYLMSTPRSSTSYDPCPAMPPSLNPWKSCFWNGCPVAYSLEHFLTCLEEVTRTPSFFTLHSLVSEVMEVKLGNVCLTRCQRVSIAMSAFV